MNQKILRIGLLCLLMISATVNLTAKYHDQTVDDELPDINDVNGTSAVSITTTSVNSTSQPISVQPIAVPVISTATVAQPVNSTTVTPSTPSNSSTQIVYPSTTNSSYLPGPQPTRVLPNPQVNLTTTGKNCLAKCRDLRGISCKKWNNDAITCCQFTGCQWPFYCKPEMRIMVDGCQNNP